MNNIRNVPRPSLEILEKLYRLGELNRTELRQLASRLEVFSAPRGSRLIELGSKDDSTLYLLSGEVELLACDGEKRRIHASSSAALRPICCLRPARYEVTSCSNINYLLIDNDLLNRYLPFEEHSSMLTDSSYLISESSSYSNDVPDDALLARIIEDLNHGKLVLPSLPTVAQKVGQAIIFAGSDTRRLANALQIDPVLAVKIIKAVNTNLGPGQSPVNSCHEAISRLGVERTTSLVVNCALRETLRFNNPLIAERMQLWWKKSIRVSAISKVLAHHSERFDADFSALSGLLHRIGEVIILDYANRLAEPISSKELDTSIEANANEVGRVALSMWNISYEIINVVSESGNLQRSHNQAPDYADIVLVAELLASIGHQSVHAQPLPSPEEVPAFRRLGLDNISTEFSVKIIQAGQEALQQAETSLVA